MATFVGAASLPVFHLASHYTVSANLWTIRLARVPSVAGLDRAGSRTFTLPDTIHPENVKASFKEGVLTVVLPKKEMAKPRQIKVEVSN